MDDKQSIMISEIIEHTKAFRAIQIQVLFLLDHFPQTTKETMTSIVQKNHTLADHWNVIHYKLEHHYPFWGDINHQWQSEVVRVALLTANRKGIKKN